MEAQRPKISKLIRQWTGLFTTTIDTSLSQHRFSWRVTVWLRWSRAAASQPVISEKCLRGTSKSVCVAFRRLTAWARRQCSAPGWPSLTPSPEVMRIHEKLSNAWQPARPQSWSSARTSCMRCSRISSASKSLSTSCFIRPVRWVIKPACDKSLRVCTLKYFSAGSI